MNPLLFFVSVIVMFLFGALHVDEGHGLFSEMGFRWLQVTYEFYFEPVYSVLKPLPYMIGMVVMIIFLPMALAIWSAKRKAYRAS